MQQVYSLTTKGETHTIPCHKHQWQLSLLELQCTSTLQQLSTVCAHTYVSSSITQTKRLIDEGMRCYIHCSRKRHLQQFIKVLADNQQIKIEQMFSHLHTYSTAVFTSLLLQMHQQSVKYYNYIVIHTVLYTRIRIYVHSYIPATLLITQALKLCIILCYIVASHLCVQGKTNVYMFKFLIQCTTHSILPKWVRVLLWSFPNSTGCNI